jgi:hypothetical protein
LIGWKCKTSDQKRLQKRASSVGLLWISIIYQPKKYPSKTKISTEFLMGLSEAKAWTVILVSEHQKGRKGCSSPGVVRKAMPAWIKGAALSFCQSSQSMATFCQEKDLRHYACNQRSKPDGRLAKNAERASQSGYGRERILAPEQSCFCLENPEKVGKGTGLGSEQYRFIYLELPAKGRR